MGAIAVNAAHQQPVSEPIGRVGRTSDRTAAVSAWSCLLVSRDERLREVMRTGATNAGWAAAECGDPAEAVRQAVVHDYPLAVIDLSSDSSSRDGCADLMRVLRTSTGNLVVICDRDASPELELWSRQEGAWMYLPSVDEQSDLARICREAKDVIEKLRGATPSGAH